MSKYVVIVGQTFGYLSVTEHLERVKGHRYVLCRCRCGNERRAAVSNLVSGRLVSCGCVHRDNLIKRNTVHGASGTRLYNIWKGMISRCCNDKTRLYKFYGQRGVTVCAVWRHNFEVFRVWAVRNGYADTLTIDRINPRIGYQPSNCRWVTRSENSSRALKGAKGVTAALWINNGVLNSRIRYQGLVPDGWVRGRLQNW